MNAALDTTTAKRSPVPVAVGGYLGDLVSWSFGRFIASRTAVRQAFERNGFAACLDYDLSAPERALSTATRSGVRYGEDHVARKLERPNKDTPAAFGVYVKQPRDGEAGDDWVCGARVRIDAHSGLAVSMAPEGKPALAGCMAVAGQIADRCNELIANVENDELSKAVVAAGRSVNWANFRKAGGAYWVPSFGAPRLRALFDEIERLGQFAPTLQPLFADDGGRTARNVGTAAEDAIKGELDELVAALAEADSGELGTRGVKSRIAHCQEVLIRCEAYREALASKADVMGKSIADIMAKFERLVQPADALVNADLLLQGVE